MKTITDRNSTEDILRDLHLYAGTVSPAKIRAIYESCEESTGESARAKLLRAGCTTDEYA